MGKKGGLLARAADCCANKVGWARSGDSFLTAVAPEIIARDVAGSRAARLCIAKPSLRRLAIALTKIWRQLTAFFGKLHEPLATRVRAVAIEDVIDSLAAADALPPALRNYAELLREKYVLPALA